MNPNKFQQPLEPNSPFVKWLTLQLDSITIFSVLYSLSILLAFNKHIVIGHRHVVQPALGQQRRAAARHARVGEGDVDALLLGDDRVHARADRRRVGDVQQRRRATRPREDGRADSFSSRSPFQSATITVAPRSARIDANA